MSNHPIFAYENINRLCMKMMKGNVKMKRMRCDGNHQNHLHDVDDDHQMKLLIELHQKEEKNSNECTMS